MTVVELLRAEVTDGECALIVSRQQAVALLDAIDDAHRALAVGLDCIRGRKARLQLAAGFKGMGVNIMQEGAARDNPRAWEQFEALAEKAFGEPQKYNDAIAATTARAEAAEKSRASLRGALADISSRCSPDPWQPLGYVRDAGIAADMADDALREDEKAFAAAKENP